MNTEAAVVLGGLALGLAAAYAWKKIKARRLDKIEAEIRSEIPEDVTGGGISLEEILEFQGIADFTCLQPCCYTPIDEPLTIWIDPDED